MADKAPMKKFSLKISVETTIYLGAPDQNTIAKWLAEGGIHSVIGVEDLAQALEKGEYEVRSKRDGSINPKRIQYLLNDKGLVEQKGVPFEFETKLEDLPERMEIIDSHLEDREGNRIELDPLQKRRLERHGN